MARDGIVRKHGIRMGQETSKAVTLTEAKFKLNMCLRAFLEFGTER